MSSGMMPPSSESGKRFIHDPKIEGVPETKATIKLLFKAINKKEILAIRIYRVTQRAGNRLEFRKLDQLMKYTDNGQEHSVSNSCIDMDLQMARLFGVSKAVLQNVIFCHQEETLWPFADQVHLKKIFDEIFDTEKYTKILLELRQEAKGYKDKKKKIGMQFEIRSKDYQIYKEILKSLEENKEKLEYIDKATTELALEVDEKNEELREFESKETRLQELNRDIHLLEHQAKELQQQFQKVTQSPLYKDFGKKHDELVLMLQELDRTKELIAARKALLLREEAEVREKLQTLDVEIITARINRMRLSEILVEQQSLSKEYVAIVESEEVKGLVESTELKEIENVLRRLREKHEEVKRKVDGEEMELVDSRNKVTVALKLKAEEEKQLREMIREKQEEANKFPETHSDVEDAVEEIKERLKRYGETAEDNIKFFKEHGKAISDAEDALINSLRLIAAKDREQYEKKAMERVKEVGAEIGLEGTTDSKTLLKVLREVINLKEKELSDAKSLLNDHIAKVSHLLSTNKPETVLTMKEIQQLSLAVPLQEQKLLLYRTIAIELRVMTNAQCTDVEANAEARIELLRRDYFDHIQAFVQSIHQFISLNPSSANKSTAILQKEFLQSTIKELSEKTNKIADDIRLMEERLASYNEPLGRINQAKLKVAELETIIRLLKDVSLKYNWIQHKRSELPINEGLEEYGEMEVKREAEKEELMKRQQSILEELRNSERVLDDRQLLQSQIEMNISKYEVQRSVKSIKTDYEQKIDARLKVMEELEKKKQLVEGLRQLEGKYHESLGEHKNISRTIQLQENQLATPQYKNIEGVIQFLQFQMIAADKLAEAILARHDAIEESVMIYHNKKMEQINKVIKDLWKLTYKGKDIDTIEIKSDAEKTGSRYHSFNYRIVFKNMDGTELDMRGRCSAGQKVLGSILIRLALAEAFCVDCGVLALDEPTTNLDTENIAGLAEALSDIITERAGNKNFQLIVISHDEQFVQALGGRFTEHIWKVDKDQRGYSTLKKVLLKEIL